MHSWRFIISLLLAFLKPIPMTPRSFKWLTLSFADPCDGRTLTNFTIFIIWSNRQFEISWTYYMFYKHDDKCEHSWPADPRRAVNQWHIFTIFVETVKIFIDYNFKVMIWYQTEVWPGSHHDMLYLESIVVFIIVCFALFSVGLYVENSQFVGGILMVFGAPNQIFGIWYVYVFSDRKVWSAFAYL